MRSTLDDAEVCINIRVGVDTDIFSPGSYGEVPAQNTSDDSAKDTRKESGYGGNQDMDTEIGA